MDFYEKSVVVTGAANGIGRGIALAFAARGARLSLADIDGQGLKAVQEMLGASGTSVHVHEVDVSRPEQVRDFCAKVYREMGRVDVLCNNAGVALAGDFDDMSLEDLEWLFGVNLKGVIHGCHYFYPRMIEQGGGGHIVNTASAGGLAPFPALAAYCCTKYGVAGLSETLRAEAARHGIGVSVLCPGAVATDIVKRGRIVSGSPRSLPDEMTEKLHHIVADGGCTTEKVGSAVVRGVERNRLAILVTPEAHLLDWSHRLNRRALIATLTVGARIAQRIL